MVGGILLVVGGGPVVAMSKPHANGFEVVLRPTVRGDGGVTAIVVTERIHRQSVKTPLVFHAPVAIPGVPHLSERVSSVVFADERGMADVLQREENGPDGKAEHLWVPSRPLGTTVKVTYSVALVSPSQGGPPVGLKAAGGGVAGNTSSFLMIPRGLASTTTRLAWNLSELPKGAVGLTGLGPGPVNIGGPPENALDQWLLAGSAMPLHRRGSAGFNAYALGRPAVDARTFLTWSEQAYATLARRFVYLGTPRYELLVRAVEGPSFATGTAKPGGGSALVTLGTEFAKGQDEAYLRSVTFHEMTHQWVGELSPESSWFSEGLTVYLSIRIGCEAGLKTPSECSSEINQTAGMFYRSAGRRLSQAEIERISFEREGVRTVSYGRGMLYFALVDQEIRRRTGGRRNLLIALRPAFEARAKGTPLTRLTFETLLARELGRKAVLDFRAVVIDGLQEPLPAADAFGARLKRVAKDWGTPTDPAPGFSWEPY